MTTRTENVLAFETTDTIQRNLTKHVGDKLELYLTHGQTIGGRVYKVGEHLVYLEKIVGGDFFDAVVEIRHIVAILKRAEQ